MPIYCVESVGKFAGGLIFVGTNFEDAVIAWNRALVSEWITVHMTVWEDGMRTMFSAYEMSQLHKAKFVDCTAIRGM